MPSSLQVHRIYNTTTNFDHPVQSAKTMVPVPVSVPENIKHRHTHAPRANQCCSAVVHTIAAPLPTVWSFVRRFDAPQSYKKFLRSCHVIEGDGRVGTLREVRVVSGLPAGSSTERLDILDDERHVMSFSVVGGDHRLSNYRSVTTLHAAEEGEGTVVVESYVVDVPAGNTEEETRGFTDTIVRCNLQSLGRLTESLTNNNNNNNNNNTHQSFSSSSSS